MKMIPAGYMAKRVISRPDWLEAPTVVDIYSVSGCMSENFTDYISYWKHNGYWLFNSVKVITSLAMEHSLDLAGCQFFFYEIHELQFDEKAKQWQSFTPDIAFVTAVIPPAKAQLEGYDIVTFSSQSSPECSPLSCNNLAKTIPVNCHCLLESFEEAKRLIEIGAFQNSEPGPCRIFAVSSILQA
jgi:hypothetical protein